MGDTNRFEAGLDGVTLVSNGERLVGGLYRGAGVGPRPTALLLHGLPGIEKSLDVAYRLRDLGWNCLYFHFRGSWGSNGVFSLTNLEDDTAAALAWLREQPSVDRTRIALIAGSTGSHPALIRAGRDEGVRAVVGISPLIEPAAFAFPLELANNFAGMLSGISGAEMIAQWNDLPSLNASLKALSQRDLLMITAGNDEIFPRAHYAEAVQLLPNARWVEKAGADHGFSACRTWLVEAVTSWLVERMGR